MAQVGGLIIEWARERGFGKVQCDDGSVVTFDASVVTQEDVQVGERVTVETAEVRGRRRTVRVQRESR